MDFDFSPSQRHWRDRVRAFMAERVIPADAEFRTELKNAPDRWRHHSQVLERLKSEARAEGLWNLFMPPSEHQTGEHHGAGLTNLDYALCAEEMGRLPWAW